MIDWIWASSERKQEVGAFDWEQFLPYGSVLEGGETGSATSCGSVLVCMYRLHTRMYILYVQVTEHDVGVHVSGHTIELSSATDAQQTRYVIKCLIICLEPPPRLCALARYPFVWPVNSNVYQKLRPETVLLHQL